MAGLPKKSTSCEAKQVVNSRTPEAHDDVWVPVQVHGGEEACDAEVETACQLEAATCGMVRSRSWGMVVVRVRSRR